MKDLRKRKLLGCILACNGDLIFIKDGDVTKYLGSVLELLIAIEEEFDRSFKEQMNMLIANYYFNLGNNNLK